MAQKIQINRCVNANIYLDGTSFLGRAEEINLPTIKFKNSEHKAIGMVGSMQFSSGIDKMEAKIKWNSMYPEVLKKAANPYKSYALQVRASIEVYGAGGRVQEMPVIIFMMVQFQDLPVGNFKQHDNVELESMLNVYACKVEINGETIYDIDVLSNIFKVDGADLLANYRNNLGI